MKKFHQDAPEHEPVEESESVEASNRIQLLDKQTLFSFLRNVCLAKSSYCIVTTNKK